MTSGIDSSNHKQGIEAHGSVLVDLSADEITRLNDRLEGADLQYDGEKYYPAITAEELRHLRLRLLSAYNAVYSKPEMGVTLAFSEIELWILKDKLPTTEQTPADPHLGRRFGHKIAVAILSLDTLDQR